MEIDLVFRIAAVGIIVAILEQAVFFRAYRKRSLGSDEHGISSFCGRNFRGDRKFDSPLIQERSCACGRIICRCRSFAFGAQDPCPRPAVSTDDAWGSRTGACGLRAALSRWLYWDYDGADFCLLCRDGRAVDRTRSGVQRLCGVDLRPASVTGEYYRIDQTVLGRIV